MTYHYQKGVVLTFFQKFYKQVIAAVALLFIATIAATSFRANAQIMSTDFESPAFTNGNVNGQNGWMKTGAYDAEVDANTSGFTSFGDQSLRISNAFTSGAFGDQTFASPLTNSAGESSATAGSYSMGTLSNHFETQFDIASTTPNAEQPGLFISVSPDRGDGSRMSYLGFGDTATGIDVTFYDVQGETNPANFVATNLGTLDRNVPHTIKMTMDFVDGASNDVVKVYIDGTLAHTGTSWENYYRFDPEASAEQSPRVVKTVLFRAGGTAAPTTSGNGFLFDNLSLTDEMPAVPDTEKPTIAFVDPSTDAQEVSGTFTVKVSATDNEALKRVAVNLYNEANTTFLQPCGSTPAATSLGVTTYDFMCDIDTMALADGTYTLRASASDESDNVKTASRQIIVNNSPVYPVNGVILKPTDGKHVEKTLKLKATYDDGDTVNDDAVQWAVRRGTCDAGVGTVLGNVDGHNDSFEWDGATFKANLDIRGLEEGQYCFVFNPTDDEGQVDVRETRNFFIDAYVPERYEDCFWGGWRSYVNPSFRNQKQCIKYVMDHKHRPHRNHHFGGWCWGWWRG